jgi:hypothetical protein
MGGYIFDEDGTTGFSDAWVQRIAPLKKKGLTHFHSFDCVNRSGEFENLSRAECDSLTGDLARLTVKMGNAGIAAAFTNEDYGRVISATRGVEKIIGSPFSLCILAILNLVSKWASVADYSGEIVYWFEDGNKQQREAAQFLSLISSHPELKKRFHVDGWGFHNRRNVPPLQAADFVAYEYQRIYHDWLTGRHDRYPFIRLLYGRPFYTMHLNPVRMMIHAMVNEFYGVVLDKPGREC